MWQEIITGIIVAIALFFALKPVLSGKKKKTNTSDCEGCHQGCEGCPFPRGE
ncbi:MAG: FeoB-associated Cys-rich membrane protein [Bacteroidetes bacterium]|nr:FeoB-associated Cys-rich membrane protein [Bacteroidota bacterium]